MKKINTVLVRTIDILTLIVLLPLTFGSVFFSRSVDFETFDEITLKTDFSILHIVFYTLTVVFVIFASARLFRSRNEKTDRMIRLILRLFMLVTSCTFGLWWIHNNPFLPVADQEKVWTAAMALAKGEALDPGRLPYFDTYPTQKVMAMTMVPIIKMTGYSITAFRYFNLLMVLITQIFFILCLDELVKGGSREGRYAVLHSDAANILTTLLTVFSPLALLSGFVYGNIASVALATVGAYGMLRFLNSKRIRWLVLPTLLLPLAILFYHSGFIAYLAFAVIMLFAGLLGNNDRKCRIASVVAVVLILVLEMTSSSAMQRRFDDRLGRIPDAGDGTPALAYLFCGLEEENIDLPGSEKAFYEQHDRDTSKAYEDARDRVLKDLSEYIHGERSLSFFWEKTSRQWFEPWFGGVLMTVYDSDSGDPGWDRFVRSDVLKSMEGFLHVLMIFIYLGAVICQAVRVLSGNSSMLACAPNIYFLGGFLFQFFWEPKPRYCLPYFLALFPLAAVGCAYALKGIERLGRHVRSQNEEIKERSIPVKIYIVAAATVFFCISQRYFTDKSFDVIPDIDYSDTYDIYNTDDIALPAGDYVVTLRYSAGEDTELAMHMDHTDSEIYPAVMDSDENEFIYELHLDGYNDAIHYTYTVDEEDDFSLEGIHIESGRPLFTDYIFLGIFFLTAAVCLMLYFTSGEFRGKDKADKALVVIIYAAVITVSLPLFSETLFWGADDPAHVMRLEGVKDAILNRQFPVYVFPKNDNGFGLLGYMYPSFFMYFAAAMRICRASIPFAMNTLYFGINILTGITAYVSARGVFDKKKPAYLFTILYLLMPYRLVNIYTRADVGESLTMCFLPLIIAGMYRCLDEEKRKNVAGNVLYITLGMTGLINSHVLGCLVTAGLVVLYAVIFIKRLANKDSLLTAGLSVLCVCLLNTGYIVPFIKLYAFGLNISDMTGKVFNGRFGFTELIGLHDFSSGTAWGGISLIGTAGIVIFITGLIRNRGALSGIKERFMAVSGILSIILFITVASEFPWDAILSIGILKKITGILQFSFRFMMISGPLLTLVTTYYLTEVKRGERVTRILGTAAILLAFISILPSIAGEIKADPYYHRLSGGTSELVLREYWPEGVTDGVFNGNRLFWSSENLIYDGYEKNGLRVDFNYNAISGEDEWMEPPILYYPGYRAVASTSEGKKYDLGVSRGDYYRVKIDLPAALSGSHVSFYYGGLWYFYIAYAISIVSAIAFTVIYLRKYKDVIKAGFHAVKEA